MEIPGIHTVYGMLILSRKGYGKFSVILFSFSFHCIVFFHTYSSFSLSLSQLLSFLSLKTRIIKTCVRFTLFPRWQNHLSSTTFSSVSFFATKSRKIILKPPRWTNGARTIMQSEIKEARTILIVPIIAQRDGLINKHMASC